MIDRRPRGRSAGHAIAAIGLGAACVLGCTRERIAPTDAPDTANVADAANINDVTDAAGGTEVAGRRRPGSARWRGYGRNDEPKVRVVAAGLRVLAIRGGGGDAGAPATPATTLNADGTRKNVALGDRIGVGDKLATPTGITLVVRSALEGLELELIGPADVSILPDETVLLSEGELKVLAAPRLPGLGMIATPDGFVVAPPETSIRVRKITTVTPAGTGTGAGTAVATWGDEWRSRRVTGPLTMTAASVADPEGLTRCQRMAERARSAWNVASSGSPLLRLRLRDAGALEATAGGAGPDPWATQTEARAAARSACAVARLLVDRRLAMAPSSQLLPSPTSPDAGSMAVRLEAAEALWRELPGLTADPASGSR